MTNFEKLKMILEVSPIGTAHERVADFLTGNESPVSCKNCVHYVKELNGERCDAPDSYSCTKEYISIIFRNWLESEAEFKV